MKFFFASAVLVMSLAYGAEPLSLIPLPRSVERHDGQFVLHATAPLQYEEGLKSEAQLLIGRLREVHGIALKLAPLENAAAKGIRLRKDPTLGLAESGYRLTISASGIEITGQDSAGVFYGTQTLLQLLPLPKVTGEARTEITLPQVKIEDAPRFAWRGMMLDVARHQHSVEAVKHFIDWLAFHKLSVFHWHLTEDQGWRIEIKKYPKLTEVGAYRESTPPYGDRSGSDGKRYGGFYSQDQIRDVVAYAAARHITVVPEVDLPGHMAAAIAAYPELGNDDIPNYDPKVVTHWGVFPYVLAPTEEVFEFLADVFSEICELFPSPYIHIGGDEAPKTQWEQSPRVRKLMAKKGLKDGEAVQSYFIKRVEKILTSKGRKLIGWDEIREGGLSPSATVMSWRGEEGGVVSAKEGHDVVMVPTSHLYFDYYQAPAEQELAKGLEYEAIGGFIPISKVYAYDPVPAALSAAEAKHVLGVQANLWSEYFKDYRKVQYHTFPRIAALAEIAWTSPERKDFQDFLRRLEGIMAHYDAAGIHRGDVYVPVKQATQDGSKVETSMGTHSAHWPELVFDGRPETFFWSDRALVEGDHLTLVFKNPLPPGSQIQVMTGRDTDGADKLESGVLEGSVNGQEWLKLADFDGGRAEGQAASALHSVRLKVTRPQESWLIVREILVEP